MSNKFVWIVESGLDSAMLSEGSQTTIESIWTTEEKARTHLKHLGECFKYTRVSDSCWRDGRGSRWVAISEHELDPET